MLRPSCKRTSFQGTLAPLCVENEQPQPSIVKAKEMQQQQQSSLLLVLVLLNSFGKVLDSPEVGSSEVAAAEIPRRRNGVPHVSRVSVVVVHLFFELH